MALRTVVRLTAKRWTRLSSVGSWLPYWEFTAGDAGRDLCFEHRIERSRVDHGSCHNYIMT